MPDELREKTAYEYRKWNPSASIGRALEFADSVLSLIDGKRCVWTEKTRSNGVIVYKTSCDKQAVTWDQKDFNENPFCQACGKRIEVKEVKDGQG